MQIREVFDRKRFVFLDGGMGTQLQARGLQPGQKPELAALEMPEVLTAMNQIKNALDPKHILNDQKSYVKGETNHATTV